MMVQDHILTSAAETNMTAAAHFGKRSKFVEQKNLLEAALLLAQSARNRGLQTRINKLLAVVPTTPDALNALKEQLLTLIDALGETYSCESSDEGEVHETKADNVEDAIAEVYGKENTIVVYPSKSGFKQMGGRRKAHVKLLSLADEHEAIYANAGDPEYYDPANTGAPGGFYYCFLFKGQGSNGKSLLVTFHTAQT